MHLDFGNPIDFIDDKVSEDVKDYGLSAYRNNLHLSHREECIVLMDWLSKMKERYYNFNEDKNAEISFRRLQLLLTFCMGEIIRMSKVECNERAILVQIIWEESIRLTKILEERMIASKNKIDDSWKRKYDEITGGLSTKIKSLNEEIASLKAIIEKEKEENKKLEAKINSGNSVLNESRDRYKALSAIVDHILANNIMDMEKFNKKQKKLMLGKIQQIKRDRAMFKKMFPGNGDAENTFDNLNKFENELEKSMAGSDKYEQPSDEIPEEKPPKKEPPSKKNEGKKENMNEQEAQTEPMGVEDMGINTEMSGADYESYNEQKILSLVDAPPPYEGPPISNIINPISMQAAPQEMVKSAQSTLLMKPAEIPKKSNGPIPVNNQASPEKNEPVNYSPSNSTKKSALAKKQSPVRSRDTSAEKAEISEDQPSENNSQISAASTKKIRVRKNKPEVKKEEEEIEEEEEKIDVKKTVKKPVIKNTAKEDNENTTRTRNTIEKRNDSLKQTINNFPTKEKLDFYNKEIEKLLKHFMDTLMPKDSIQALQKNIMDLISGSSLDSIILHSPRITVFSTLSPTSAKNNFNQNDDTKSPANKYPSKLEKNELPIIPNLNDIKNSNCAKESPKASQIDNNNISPSKDEAKLNLKDLSPTDRFNENTIKSENAGETAMDDTKRELPKKLIAVMNSMTDNITNLETDEYGEWLLDITKDDDLVKRIIKNGHLLTLLLRHLYKKKGIVDNDKDIRLHDMNTQTETVFTAMELEKTLSEGIKEYSGKVWMDKETQTDFINTTDSKPRPVTPMSLKANKVYVYDEKRQLQSTTVTVARPFILGKYTTNHSVAIEHPSKAFVNVLIEKLSIFSF